MYSMFEDKKVPACGTRSCGWQNDRRVPGGFIPIEELVDSSVRGMSAEDLLTGDSDQEDSIADAKEYLLYFPPKNGTSAGPTIRGCRLGDPPNWMLDCGVIATVGRHNRDAGLWERTRSYCHGLPGNRADLRPAGV